MSRAGTNPPALLLCFIPLVTRTGELPRTPSRNCLKSPEGTSDVASWGTEAALFGPFWPGIPTKSAFEAPLEPLFRQFQREARRIPLPRTPLNSVAIALCDPDCRALSHDRSCTLRAMTRPRWGAMIWRCYRSSTTTWTSPTRTWCCLGAGTARWRPPSAPRGPRGRGPCRPPRRTTRGCSPLAKRRVSRRGPQPNPSTHSGE
jgi:hypothetical protein